MVSIPLEATADGSHRQTIRIYEADGQIRIGLFWMDKEYPAHARNLTRTEWRRIAKAFK